ncbi:MAG: lipoyl(octanoyl) transferase LipB [Deinococcus sp.]|nr:lipoyl(octanoyl) transferase LipB [Deinococcus sp.]
MLACLAVDLGTIGYSEAWALQRQLHQARLAGQVGDVLLLLEHPHVYTAGRTGNLQHLLLPPHELARFGATFEPTDRGGDLTYHGPGQLVGYPILDLRQYGQDVHRYLRLLEEVLIGVARDYGLAAQRLPGYTGVWVGDGKLAAIGVRISRWVTLHGFALNISPDLGYFRHIVPCGIVGKAVTSLAEVVVPPPSRAEVLASTIRHFGAVFQCELRGLSPQALRSMLIPRKEPYGQADLG